MSAGRRVSVFAGLFLLMLVAAAALMVRFTGPQAPAADAAPAVAAEPMTAPSGLIIPVAGIRPETITDTWGQARDNGARAHQATDIVAPGGAPVIAAAPGIVEKLHDSAAGGRTLYVRSANRRWSYYYAHLAEYYPGIAEGVRVRAGQQLGFVGDTGNAGPGNYHLHFAIARMRPEDRWWQGEPVNPYPLLVGKGAPR